MVEDRTPPLVLGSAFDAAAEWMLRRKWRGEWTNAEALALRFSEEWEAQLARPEPVDWGGRDARAIHRDGINLVTAPATLAALRSIDLAPHPDDKSEPGLQVRVELAVPGVSVPVLGYVDVLMKDPALAGGTVILDLKTARRAWARGREQKELQARVYLAALWQAGTPFAYARSAYWVFIPGMTPESCRVQRLEPLLSEGDILKTLTALRRSWQQVKSGVFPGNPHSWRCNAGCPLWTECFG